MLNPQIFCERHFRRFFPHCACAVTWSGRAAFFIDIQPFDWLHPSTPQPLIPLVRGIGKTLEAFWVIREFAGSLRLQATRPR